MSSTTATVAPTTIGPVRFFGGGPPYFGVPGAGTDGGPYAVPGGVDGPYAVPGGLDGPYATTGGVDGPGAMPGGADG
ncbi:hypothetical protein, partial [Nonomuraea lactucae]|uniref:hypothetical protein n=1 Tax=Nonomuraea lactucae TaxID=2249762 RepID=UPI003B838DE0